MPDPDILDEKQKETLKETGEAKEIPVAGSQQATHVQLNARAPQVVANSNAVSSSNLDTKQLQPGTIVGRVYKIEALIGTGGMGSVYKAVQTITNQQVALKLLHPHQMDETSVRRFQQESRAISALNHPHIASAHYFDVTEDGVPFLAMDLVDGGSLSSLLQDKECLSWQRALDIVIQICSALGHAHERGVVHRDLKPSNVLLTKVNDKEDYVKIVDFGIAKVSLDEMKEYTLTETGAVFGTPLYMSPEQCRGLKADSRSDIYALGCVLYELLTGNPPHVGTSPLDTIFKHLNERAKSISAVASSTSPSWPEELPAIVSRALERDPQKRYQSMDEFRHDLAQVLERQPGQKIKIKARLPISRKIVASMIAVAALFWFAGMHVYRVAHWGDSLDKTATIEWQSERKGNSVESYLALWKHMNALEKEASDLLKTQEHPGASDLANQLTKVAQQVSERDETEAGNAFDYAGKLLTFVDHKTPQDEINALLASQGQAAKFMGHKSSDAEALQRSVVANIEKFKDRLGQAQICKAFNLLGDILYAQEKYREANSTYKDYNYQLLPGANDPYFNSDNFFGAVARRADTYYQIGLAAMRGEKPGNDYPPKDFEMAILGYKRALPHWLQIKPVDRSTLTKQELKQASLFDRDSASRFLFDQATAYFNMARAASSWHEYDRINGVEERERSRENYNKAHPGWDNHLYKSTPASQAAKAPDPAPLYEKAIERYRQSTYDTRLLPVAEGEYGDYLWTQHDYLGALSRWTAACDRDPWIWDRFSMLKSAPPSPR